MFDTGEHEKVGVQHRGAVLANEARGICHGQEWCASCHVDAPGVPATQAP